MGQQTSTTWPAQVSPAPKASRSARSPATTRPSSRSRPSASGTDAAEVLPVSVMSSATTTSGAPRRRAGGGGGAGAGGARLDDAQVRLVGDERREVGGGDACGSAGRAGDAGKRRRRPPEDCRTVEAQLAADGDVDEARAGSVTAPHDRPDTGRVADADDRRSRSVAEQDGRASVGPVDPVGELLRSDDDDVARGPGPDGVRRDREPVAEPCAGRV